MKVVYNACYGGFGLSETAKNRYAELSGKKHPIKEWNIDRYDPFLVQVVEELGIDANGEYAKLQIYNISLGVKWRIEEYDGKESIMTINDYNWNTAT